MFVIYTTISAITALRKAPINNIDWMGYVLNANYIESYLLLLNDQNLDFDFLNYY
jgi:hypothetical protein